MATEPVTTVERDVARLDALRLVDRALGREAHVLVRRPELTWQQLHNRVQWEDEPVTDRLTAERERRSRPGERPWLLRCSRLRESEALVRTLSGHTSAVNGCAVSPDGIWIVSASHDDTLKVWDAASGAERATLTGHTGSVRACAISPDGDFVVSASDDHTCKIWDAATGKERASLPLLGSLTCLALHPWQPFAACADIGGGVHLIESVGIEYGSIVVTATDLGKGAGYQVRCPFCNRFSDVQPEWLGTEIACPREGCGKPLRVNPLKVPARQALVEARQERPAPACAPAHDSLLKRLLKRRPGRGDAPRLLPLLPSLTAPGGPLLRTLSGHRGGVRGLAAVRGTTLASIGDDGALRIWDVARGDERRTIDMESMGLWTTAGVGDLTPNTERVTATPVGLSGSRPAFDPRGVQSVAVTPDNWLLMAGTPEGIHCWDLETPGR